MKPAGSNSRREIILACVSCAVLAFLLLVSRSYVVPRPDAPSQATLVAMEVKTPEESVVKPDQASTSQDYFFNKVRLPILVYHVVRPAYTSDTPEITRTAVTPDVFDAQMKYLRDAGYTVVPYSVLEDYFYVHTPLPEHAVILTFDDAWEDQYQYAFPILKKYGYTATFFVPSNFPGHSSFMSWDQLKTLQDAGMTIESHSRTHPYLTRVTSSSSLEAEISGSKAKLEAELGTSVDAFNYPFGVFSTSTREAVKRAGYSTARSEQFGLYITSKTDPLALPALNAPVSLSAFESYFPMQ